MANIAEYGARRQTLRPVQTQKLDANATPDAFGAGIGRGMQALAAGVGDAAQAYQVVQGLEDKAAVDQRVNKFSDYARERTYDPEKGYVMLNGENAVNGRGAFENDIEAQRKEMGKDLTPHQQKLYDEATQARRQQAYDTGIRHAAGQRKVWFDEASTARLDTFANDALAMYNEPDKLALNLAAAAKEIDDKAAVNGWAPEKTKTVQETFLSGVHKNIVLKQAVADPMGAKKWLDAHRKDMTEGDQYELDKALDGPVLEATAQQEAERIMKGDTAARPPRATADNIRMTTTDAGVDVDNVTPDVKTSFGKLQTSMGSTLVIRSGYRDEEKNKAVGGADHSQHTHGNALDIDISKMSKQERLVLINKAFDAGFTGFGVGENTLHVDLGPPRSWGYATSSGGAPVPAYARGLVDKRLAEMHGGKAPPSEVQRSTTGAVDSAAAMLRSYEGFKTDTYWDVNANRVGYGSDTITDANGNVRRVREGDKVTQTDAERDLSRRLGNANLRIQKDVGADVWSRIPAAARGAVLSVDYNYGGLPEGVKKAVASGDVGAIADAVEALQNDNGGVNRDRRLREAAVIRSGELPDGVTVSNTYGFVGPQYIADQVAGISDPRLRAATASAMTKMYAAQDALDRRTERQNKLAAEKYIIQNPGRKPTDLPLEIQLQLGTEGMNKLWSYNDQIEQHGKVETDEVLYSDLMRKQAEDPYAFANNVDLFDYIDRLSVGDRRTLQQLQADAIKDQRTNKTEALTKAKSIASAMEIADDRLVVAGIKKTGKQATTESVHREAQFQRALVQRMREFQDKEKRIPNDYEVSDMVDQLLVPIIMKTPGALWGTNSKDGFVFEAPFRADNATVEINVPYEQIPSDVRLVIREELTKELGREPTQDEVRKDYAEFVLSGK